jgi:hypothetical protein
MNSGYIYEIVRLKIWDTVRHILAKLLHDLLEEMISVKNDMKLPK